jgi:hypothetical protein
MENKRRTSAGIAKHSQKGTESIKNLLFVTMVGKNNHARIAMVLACVSTKDKNQNALNAEVLVCVNTRKSRQSVENVRKTALVELVFVIMVYRSQYAKNVVG